MAEEGDVAEPRRLIRGPRGIVERSGAISWGELNAVQRA